MTPIDVLPRRSIAVGGACLCLMALAATIADPRAALTGWLSAFAFTMTIPIASLCLLLMIRIIPGSWREEFQAISSTVSLSQPLALAAVAPILLGVPWIYEWTNGAKLSAFQSVYLTPLFFDLRSVVTLLAACWLSLAVTDFRATKSLAIGGLIAFVILQNMLAVDWLMSLDPTFHSSGFGLYILSGELLTALAALILLRLAGGNMQGRMALLSTLLFVALLFWTYLAFMQYFIIWSGNLTQGAVWYQRRGRNGWDDVEYAIVAIRLVPLLALFFPPVRESPAILAILCGCVLLGSFLECAWLTLPALPSGIEIAVFADLTASIGLGMLLLAAVSLASATGRTRRIAG